MIVHLWLIELPSTDPAFGPLNHAAEFDRDEWPLIARAHREAILAAAWGRSPAALEARADALMAVARSRADELEATGLALGATAAKVAIREHYDTATEVA